MAGIGWASLYTLLFLISPAVITYACAIYFRRTRTGLAVALLVGATGELVTAAVTLSAATLIVPRMPGEPSMMLIRWLNYSGMGFGLLFGVALVMVLKQSPLANTSADTETAGSHPDALPLA